MPTDTESLQKIVDLATRNVFNDFALANMQEQDLSICLVDMNEPKQLRWAGHRENENFYPASIIKIFLAVAAYHYLEEGQIKLTPELTRAVRDMIVDSSNDAASYVIDLLTNTTSGPELSEEEMKTWQEKRNAINAFYELRGYQNFNLNQKPVGDGRYGRERVSVERTCMNKLSAKITAQLMTEIIEERAASPEHCRQLLALMKRDLSVSSDDRNSQTHAFLGSILPDNAQCWSKAGWTSQVRHDAVYFKLPNGKKFCLVVFTTNYGNDLLPAIGAEIITALELL